MTGTGKLNVGVTIIGLIAPCAILVIFLRLNPVDAWTWVGLAIFFPALVLWTAAHVQLGKSFAVRARAQELVTRGVYSKIRHPIYVSGFFLLLSLIIVMRRPEVLVVLAAVTLIQVRRVRNEERALEAKFGQAYVEYKRKTWF
jgi:protein-S-isoprenylcysteine O-methyltransferase Ste14